MSDEVPLVCPCCGQHTGTLDLDQVRRSARLSPMENEVFEILGRAKGDFVKAARVVELLYADDPNGGPEGAFNNLSIYVMNIRKKLKYMRAPYTVDSSYGIGYRIVAHSPEPLKLPPRRRVQGVPGTISTPSMGVSPVR